MRQSNDTLKGYITATLKWDIKRRHEKGYTNMRH